ncbi:MAG: DUF3303 domain-containing protein [Limisphaerales bacterium]|jgi:hypothetical protein
MHYVAIGNFGREDLTAKEIVSRRRNYTYPSGFKNVESYLDVHGGRVVVHFETDSAESIMRYTADWPEVAFDIFPVVPSGKAWEIYLQPGG